MFVPLLVSVFGSEISSGAVARVAATALQTWKCPSPAENGVLDRRGSDVFLQMLAVELLASHEPQKYQAWVTN